MRSENRMDKAAPAPMECGGQQFVQETVMRRFTARVKKLGPLFEAHPAVWMRVLEEVKAVARSFHGSAGPGSASGYERQLLCEDPGHWSLAAIILRPGQQTHPHDHGGWGCAATAQGIERDRRFVYDLEGNLVLSSERDYPPGTGYVFNAVDIHQPAGADPQGLTVALHFLVEERSW